MQQNEHNGHQRIPEEPLEKSLIGASASPQRAKSKHAPRGGYVGLQNSTARDGQGGGDEERGEKMQGASIQAGQGGGGELQSEKRSAGTHKLDRNGVPSPPMTSDCWQLRMTRQHVREGLRDPKLDQKGPRKSGTPMGSKGGTTLNLGQRLKTRQPTTCTMQRGKAQPKKAPGGLGERSRDRCPETDERDGGGDKWRNRAQTGEAQCQKGLRCGLDNKRRETRHRITGRGDTRRGKKNQGKPQEERCAR